MSSTSSNNNNFGNLKNNKQTYNTQLKSALKEIDEDNFEDLYDYAQGIYIDIDDTHGALLCITVPRGSYAKSYKHYLSGHPWHICDLQDANSPSYIFKFDASQFKSFNLENLETLHGQARIKK